MFYLVFILKSVPMKCNRNFDDFVLWCCEDGLIHVFFLKVRMAASIIIFTLQRKPCAHYSTTLNYFLYRLIFSETGLFYNALFPARPDGVVRQAGGGV